MRAEHLGDAVQQLHRHRVAEGVEQPFADEHPDHAAAAAAQRRGDRVGARVAELGRGGEHALAGGRGDARAAGERQRRRRRGDPGAARRQPASVGRTAIRPLDGSGLSGRGVGRVLSTQHRIDSIGVVRDLPSRADQGPAARPHRRRRHVRDRAASRSRRSPRAPRPCARRSGSDDRAARPAPALHVGRVHRGPSAVRADRAPLRHRLSGCSGAPSRSGSASGSRRWASRAAPSLPRRPGLVLVGLGIGVWDVVDERRGRGRRTAAGPLADAAAARGVQPRHGRGRRASARRRPPRRSRSPRRSAAIAVLSPLLHDLVDPALPAAHRPRAGAGDAAARACCRRGGSRARCSSGLLVLRVRVHRGVGQRLDRRRARRRPRHRARRSARSPSACSSRR